MIEYVSAKMEALITKKMHERVVPFKVEMGSMIESLGRANSEEVSSLNHDVRSIESMVKGQDKVVTSLCDKYQVITSQIQLLESSGVKQSNEDAQLSNLQKIRENMKAEATLVMNERVKEEIEQLEERLAKRFEDLEKRSKATEKKIEAERTESDSQKGHYEELSAKLEDIGKLVAELTVNSSKQNKEEISKTISYRLR
jgi:chromosome segregation ATPase